VGCMTATSVYLLRNDRALLERRLRTKEKAGKQKAIILLAVFLILPSYIIPGLDVRFGWSQVPAWLSVVALVLFVVGYAIFFLVIRENSYASRVVEVEEGQKVISSGPYGVVRHPMYIGVMLIYLCAPLALGSYWALIPGSLMLVVIVTRLLNEEEILAKELPGYMDYMEKVKYRLIPGVW
jgi:protein-S-isoprenylcysteine O-methyltransferase Ste14